MAKETISIRTNKKARRRTGDDQPQASRLPGQAPGINSLQHQVGNRATQRALQRGRLEGEVSLRDLSLAQIRQAVAVQAAAQATAQAALAPGIQRQEEDGKAPVGEAPRDKAPGSEEIVALATPKAAQTGQVTIKQPQIDEYEVTGKTLAEVIGQLDPEEWGHCSWTVDYNYDTANGKTTKVNITLHLIIRMPRWGEGYNDASPAARKEWQRMLTVLRKHEDGHADIARKWAPIFKGRLLSQPEEKADSIYKQALQELDDESKKYDADTKHGQAQGVSLDTSIQ